MTIKTIHVRGQGVGARETSGREVLWSSTKLVIGLVIGVQSKGEDKFWLIIRFLAECQEEGLDII